MVLKRLFQRLSTPVSETDMVRLREFCSTRPDVIPISEAVARVETTVMGEIASLRIVPHAASPWLEATITDGSGSIVAVWTGRRRIAGISPGKRLVLCGRPAQTSGKRLQVYNPRYELL